MNLLQIRSLKLAEVAYIYNTHFQEDFPLAERKPWELIKSMYLNKNYICYGLYENNILRAYAFFCKAEGAKNLLMDYLSVVSRYRSGGYGGRFLQLLKTAAAQECEGFILEVEHLDHAQDEDDLITRNRRFNFYFANGVQETSIESSVKKVVYSVIYYPFVDTWEDEILCKELEDAYHLMFDDEEYQRYVEYIQVKQS